MPWLLMRGFLSPLRGAATYTAVPCDVQTGHLPYVTRPVRVGLSACPLRNRAGIVVHRFEEIEMLRLLRGENAVMGDLGDGDLERFVGAVGEVVAGERALREPVPSPTS